MGGLLLSSPCPTLNVKDTPKFSSLVVYLFIIPVWNLEPETRLSQNWIIKTLTKALL